MTAALPISHKRLGDVIARYGVACQISYAPTQDEEAPWQIDESRHIEEGQGQILLSSIIERSISNRTEYFQEASALLRLQDKAPVLSRASLIHADNRQWAIQQLVLLYKGADMQIYKIELTSKESSS